jgi:Ca-activated chloride channel family protein
MFLEHAHFLRPWWLLLLIAPLIIYFLNRSKVGISSAWQRIIDPHLLPHVIAGQSKLKSARYKRFYVPLFLVLISLSLAGPTIKKIPDSSALIKKPVVILLELSPDMLSHDISPSRLKRALYKLKDFLNLQKAREIALIAFAGDAHVVVPLTEDYKTILNLSDSLSPTLMPTQGSNLLEALKLAHAMGDNNIIIMSSSNINDAEQVKNYIKQNPLRLNFWWFATDKGAPVLGEDGIFKKNPDGSVKMSKLRSDLIGSLTSSSHARSQLFTPDAQDIKSLSKNIDEDYRATPGEKENFFDTWFDLGPYLLILAMLLFLWATATQGTSWYMLCFLLLAPIPRAHAGLLTNFFSRPDQQAYKALKNGDMQKAAELYPDDFGKGTAYFKAKNFEKAVEHLQKVPTSDGHYNLGNAYAQLGKIKEAIEAYKQALKLDPKNLEAQHNKEVLEKLAQDQKQEDKKQEDKKQEDKKQEEQKQEDKKQEDKKPEEQKQEDKKQEDKKPEEQKQEDKKQEDKKTEDQKQEDKKPEEQKQEDKKQEDKKPEEQKQEDKKQENKKPEEQKQEEQKQDSPAQEVESDADKNMRYYLNHLEQNNNLYLKRKFLYESRQRKGGQQ